ncbi:unnamed protein product, partial [Meganyctiphanes norvegica]
RDYAALDHIQYKKTKISDILSNHILSKEALEWNEKAMHESLKNTDITIWDSLLPFNLANIRECEAIREVLHKIYDWDDSTVSKKHVPHRIKKGSYSYDYKTKDIKRNTENTIVPAEHFWKEIRPTGKDNYENNHTSSINSISSSISSSSSSNSSSSSRINYYNNDSYDNTKHNNNQIYQNYIDYILGVLNKMPIKNLRSLYKSPVINCNDDLHNSQMTIQDEFYIIFNLLCNRYEPKQGDLCCQI